MYLVREEKANRRSAESLCRVHLGDTARLAHFDTTAEYMAVQQHLAEVAENGTYWYVNHYTLRPSVAVRGKRISVKVIFIDLQLNYLLQKGNISIRFKHIKILTCRPIIFLGESFVKACKPKQPL